MAWKKQVVKFGIIGVISSLIDLTVYSLLFAVLGVIPSVSKALSFISGSIFGYFSNRKWTFRSGKSLASSMIPYAVLYIVSLGLNVVTNSAILYIYGKENIVAVICAFIFATGVSATTNFLGLKFIVFRATAH